VLIPSVIYLTLDQTGTRGEKGFKRPHPEERKKKGKDKGRIFPFCPQGGGTRAISRSAVRGKKGKRGKGGNNTVFPPLSLRRGGKERDTNYHMQPILLTLCALRSCGRKGGGGKKERKKSALDAPRSAQKGKEKKKKKGDGCDGFLWFLCVYHFRCH